MNKTNPLSLPEAVARYLDSANRFAAHDAVECFTADAIVCDEDNVHVGSAAIEHWVSQTSLAFQPRATVTDVHAVGNGLKLVVSVAGAFPTSPIALVYNLRLHNGKIAELSIA